MRDQYSKQLKNIESKLPKNSDLAALEKKIEEGIAIGYSKIFCMIDMDNKKEGQEKKAYLQLKEKYKEAIVKEKEGISCEVRFFETDRCTELFFLYYFDYTTKTYHASADIVKALAKKCGYKKNIKIFKKGLHQLFLKNGGSLQTAIKNAKASCKDKDRGYTYSQLGYMLTQLGIK